MTIDGQAQFMSFESFKLPEFLLRTLKKLHIEAPTPVQQATIPQILSGHNIVALSPTGSGKTAAFVLPVVTTLSKDPYGIYCLALSPTRELAEQISQQFKAFGGGMQISVTNVYGGTDFSKQANAIEKNPHIIVATPGRLLQHLEGTTKFAFDELRYLILDEVDRMFNEGFWQDVEKILQYIPQSRQTLLYTATLRDEIPIAKALTEPPSSTPMPFSNLGNCRYSDDKNTFYWTPTDDIVPQIEHQMIPVPPDVREIYLVVLLEEIVKENELSQVIVFVNKCETCELVTLILRQLSYKAAMLHSEMKQDERLKSLDDFRAGRQRILVATDIAARGLDIIFVDIVIHYNLPTSHIIYEHRSGRTARQAGRTGRSILFISGNLNYESKLVTEIENKIGHPMEILKIEEKKTIEKMKTVLNARQHASMDMHKTNFGEATKQLKAIKEAQKELSGE